MDVDNSLAASGRLFPDFWQSGPIGAFNFYPLLAAIIAAVEVGVFLSINEATPCGGIIEIRNGRVAKYSDSMKSNDKYAYSEGIFWQIILLCLSKDGWMTWIKRPMRWEMGLAF